MIVSSKPSCGLWLDAGGGPISESSGVDTEMAISVIDYFSLYMDLSPHRQMCSYRRGLAISRHLSPLLSHFFLNTFQKPN